MKKKGQGHKKGCECPFCMHGKKKKSWLQRLKELWNTGNGITYCNKCHVLLDENRGRSKIKSVLHVEMQKEN